MKIRVLSATTVLVFALLASAAWLETRAEAQHGSPPRGGMQSAPSMPGMMKMHEAMMAEMKANDAKLDALITEMNAATGEARTAALTAVVNELARQHKTMHAHAGMMHQHMMGMMGGHGKTAGDPDVHW